MVLTVLRVQIDPYISLPQLLQYLFKLEVITRNKSHTESLLEDLLSFVTLPYCSFRNLMEKTTVIQVPNTINRIVTLRLPAALNQIPPYAPFLPEEI